MRKSDLVRNDILKSIISEGKTTNKRISLTMEDDEIGTYHEILTIDEINRVSKGGVSQFIEDFIYNRLDELLEENNLSVDYDRLVMESSDLYDGYDLKVPIRKIKPKNMLEDFFKEVDDEVNKSVQQPAPKQPPAQPQQGGNQNNASNTPITKEPGQMHQLPGRVKKEKTQNPKKVDLILRTVFESKFLKYKLTTDAGNWKPEKKPDPDGKLHLIWENTKIHTLIIDTLLFPSDTNKIVVKILNRGGEMLMETFFEIYRIPTDEFLAEKFFRKTFFNLLKKYVDTNVIKLDPFVTEYVFWKSDNPTYSYSFSSPNKNKIILDLISFINTAQKPILDDFFEQNNLKHKQGYLQTLLDSSEAAGIFRFKREGNEIVILRGPNYKAFLEGKVRRVVS